MLVHDWLAGLKHDSQHRTSRRNQRRRKTSRRLRTTTQPEQLEIRTLPSSVPFTPLPIVIDYTEQNTDAPIRTDGGMSMTSLARTDDGSSASLSLGFTITIGNTDYSNVYINNNGNLTFTSSLSAFTPFGISSSSIPLLAPFFADVDTRDAGSGLVSYGFTQIDGRNAMVVNWDDVGYFNRKVNKLNDFQLVLIDRSDIEAGAFDFEFNYEAIEWETGDFSGGSNGLGGTSARAGFSNGVDNRIEFIGSGINGAFLDSGTNTLSGHNYGSVVDGRFRFQVRDGEILSPVSLDDDSVEEGSALGTTISTFSPFDPNTDNIYTYTLVSGNGDTDNASFTIVGDELRTNTALNFDTKSTYTIRVQAVNQYTVGFERILTVNVVNVNQAPTDIDLTGNTVAENSSVGTAVGTFSTTDPDAANTFTYTLVTGTGDTDNAAFTIVGNELRTNAAFNFENQSSYTIRVRSTDQGNLTCEEVFNISVTNVNEDPTDIALSNDQVLPANSVGTTVGTLSATDPDASGSFTYSLVTGTGSTDNASFTIVGNELRTSAILNFSAQTTFSVRIRVTDQGSLSFEKIFTISRTPTATFGAFRDGNFFLDSSGNRQWNGTSGGDSLLNFSAPGDLPLAGDWNGDGFSEIGVWRKGVFYLDLNANGTFDGTDGGDLQFGFGSTKDTPLIGDWNGDGISDVGVWRKGVFYLDANGNRAWNENAGGDAQFEFGEKTDTPLAGDWNGDGLYEVGLFRNGDFLLDYNANRVWNDSAGGDLRFGFSSSKDIPVTGDWNGDGKTDVGVFRKGSFYIDLNANYRWDDGDSITGFSAANDTPLVGIWAPSVSSSGPSQSALVSTIAPKKKTPFVISL